MFRLNNIVQSLKTIGTYSMGARYSYSSPVREAEPPDQFTVDPLFFLQDVHFLVEGVHYKLPRKDFVNNSEVLRMTIPDSDHGGTIANPLRLHGITRDEFGSFLQVLFPKEFGIIPDLTTAQWRAVLKLSTLWKFETIRSLAIDAQRTIIHTDPVLAIILARDYEVGQWLLPAINNLAKRPHSLTTAEMDMLGNECTSKICKIRDHAINYVALRGDVLDLRENVYFTPDRSNIDFTSLIEHEFSL